MSLSRHLIGLATAVLLSAVLAVPVVAGQTTTTRYALEAYSNNCQYRDEYGCVNVTVTLHYDTATGVGRWCVSTNDNRDVAPPPASGCVETGAVTATSKSISVEPTRVPSVLASDCHPGDECPTASVDIVASASFTRVGKATTTTRAVGKAACGGLKTTQVVSVAGTVTVDGTVYSLPGSDPTAHHRAATLTQETIRYSARCS